jgi:Protein of unknown function (DUF2865)
LKPEANMARRSVRQAALGLTIVLCASSVMPSARAEDFLSALFGAFGGRRLAPPQIVLPFANEGVVQGDVPRARSYGGGQAYCVRSCDGRYFPIAGPDNQSKAASCNNFCPASETRLVYGSTIDNAATETGKPYSELPNAFRYRNEIVAGCTCNGKDQIGLAPISIEKDPTLRKGDLVAGANGLLVANGADRRGAQLNFSPASERLRARYQSVPVTAQE